MAGFAEAAAIYATYRVIASRIHVTLGNNSATVPITLMVAPLNADPTNAMSGANVLAMPGQPYCKTRELGLLGSPATIINHKMTTQTIWGDPAIYYDHNFSSLVTTVPANNWFWNVAIYSPAFIAAQVYVTVQIECDVEFFDRIFLPA